MTFRARGVLCTLLSHEDGWQQSLAFTLTEGREGRDAVRASFAELEDLGYIRRERIQGKSGHWTTETHVYDYPIWGESQGTGEPTTGEPTVGIPGVSSKNPNEQPLEEEPLLIAKPSSATESRYTPEFIEFWNAYPRHKDKGDAATAFKAALKRAPLTEIVLGAKRLAGEWREAEFIPYAATWLRGDGWLDEPDVEPWNRVERDYHVAVEADPDGLAAFDAAVKSLPWVGER